MLDNPITRSVCLQSVIILAAFSSCYQSLGKNVMKLNLPPKKQVSSKKYPPLCVHN